MQGGTCTITFSRGPATSGNSCQQFQTSADPMLADPAAGDYHLLPGSPMIDAGDLADPPAGAVDFDGDPRAIDGNGDCVARRDIGADELVPATATDCDPPETTITKGHAFRVRATDQSGNTDPTPAIHRWRVKRKG